MKKNLTLSCKKINLNGKIEKNHDCGLGYTIVWEDSVLQKLTQRTAASPADILQVVAGQLAFISQVSQTNENNKYNLAKNKVLQALFILNQQQEV